MLPINPKVRPDLDPEFVPAALWNRAYAARVAKDAGARPFALVLARPDGSAFRHYGRVLWASDPDSALTFCCAERLFKFVLWMKGGSLILVAGAREVATALAKAYGARGERAFDDGFVGEEIFGEA